MKLFENNTAKISCENKKEERSQTITNTACVAAYNVGCGRDGGDEDYEEDGVDEVSHLRQMLCRLMLLLLKGDVFNGINVSTNTDKSRKHLRHKRTKPSPPHHYRCTQHYHSHYRLHHQRCVATTTTSNTFTTTTTITTISKTITAAVRTTTNNKKFLHIYNTETRPTS